MKISLIVAVSMNDVIGADGGLPWYLPDDFRFFREMTMGKPVVMGRRTWESIGRPLPGRRNIVITRTHGFRADGAEAVSSVSAAIDVANGADEIMVIGGGEIYRVFLPRAGRVYLTRVECRIEGDTVFPPLDAGEWRCLSSEAHAADTRHAYAFEFRTYERIRQPD